MNKPAKRCSGYITSDMSEKCKQTRCPNTSTTYGYCDDHEASWYKCVARCPCGNRAYKKEWNSGKLYCLVCVNKFMNDPNYLFRTNKSKKKKSRHYLLQSNHMHKNAICIEEDCDELATHGKPGKPATVCPDHSESYNDMHFKCRIPNCINKVIRIYTLCRDHSIYFRSCPCGNRGYHKDWISDVFYCANCYEVYREDSRFKFRHWNTRKSKKRKRSDDEQLDLTEMLSLTEMLNSDDSPDLIELPDSSNSDEQASLNNTPSDQMLAETPIAIHSYVCVTCGYPCDIGGTMCFACEIMT